MPDKKRAIQQLKEAQQQPIVRVTCSGGGAKGIVYGGAYKAMHDTGIFKGVEEFSGASAGALTAAIMALGMPPAIVREQLLSTNLQDLMGKPVGTFLGKNPPGISFLTKDGKPLEQFIRDNIIGTVKNTLQSIDADLLDRAKEDPDFNKLLLQLADDAPRITFGDLAQLNQHFPAYFKKLIVPAVRFPDGALQIFNCEDTPEVEIALACRASSSLPVVLQPVEIEVNGIIQKFVDGGLFDNLPTDYFDKNEAGDFLPNQKPNQTLVFAFGEGIDNRKNQVFQALYSSRWDEIITVEFLRKILNEAIQLYKTAQESEDRVEAPKEQAHIMIQAVRIVLVSLEEQNQIHHAEVKIIMDALKKSFNEVLLQLQEERSLGNLYQEEKDDTVRLHLLSELVQHKIKPILYHAGLIERLKRDVLVSLFGDMKTPYKNTEQKEVGYQRLRTQYPLRTVELRVGSIKTTHFNQAMRTARVLDALGYLDTINHLTNHELDNPDEFDATQFYIALVDKFQHIFTATLLSSGKNPHKNSFLQEIAVLKKQLKLKNEHITEAQISRQVYQLIKDRVEQRLDTQEAFALSRATEYQNGTLTAEQLFAQTYEEGFKRSTIFSVSHITGEYVFQSSTLHESLNDKNMFELYYQQRVHQRQTRTDRVFDSLNKIGDFQQAYHNWAGTLEGERPPFDEAVTL